MDAKIYAGNTLEFKKNLSEYPASSWTLTYTLVNQNNTYSFDATADGDTHVVSVPAATTANWVSGVYKYYAHVSDGTDRFMIESATVEILPDPTSGAFDTRTHVKKVLDALEAVIEGRATHDQASYTISGMQLNKMGIEDLMLFRDKYKAEYKRELQAEKLAKGLKTGNKVYVRF